jgi:hypothetical protein
MNDGRFWKDIKLSASSSRLVKELQNSKLTSTNNNTLFGYSDDSEEASRQFAKQMKECSEIAGYGRSYYCAKSLDHGHKMTKIVIRSVVDKMDTMTAFDTVLKDAAEDKYGERRYNHWIPRVDYICRNWKSGGVDRNFSQLGIKEVHTRLPFTS